MKTEDVLFPEVLKQNNKQILELKDEIRSGEWMMCLGAGISISAGLPNWFGLLAKITARLLPLERSEAYYGEKEKEAYDKDLEEFYKELGNDPVFFQKMEAAYDGAYEKTFAGINVLEAAEYIRNFLALSVKTPNAAEDEESKNLQKRIDWYMNYFISEACRSEIDLKSEKIRKSTLGAVAGLMKNEKNSIIHSVITYNYDNLLETYLRDVCGCNKNAVHSIVKKDELRDFDEKTEWNIYHVHGRIPVIEYPGEEMSDSVILTESDYYREERVNYSWTNILQSYAIARANLMFIGFSGADYNFRRIIKYVKQEEILSHERYIFFSIDDIVSAVLVKEAKNKQDVEKCIEIMNRSVDSEYAFEKLFINYMIQAQTQYWKNHGLKVIWSSHDELPGVLESLHV